MTEVYVFDDSALVALFDAYQQVYDFLTEADAGALRRVFPTVATAKANT